MGALAYDRRRDRAAPLPAAFNPDNHPTMRLLIPLALGLAAAACTSPKTDTLQNQDAPASANETAPKAKTVALGVDGMT